MLVKSPLHSKTQYNCFISAFITKEWRVCCCWIVVLVPSYCNAAVELRHLSHACHGNRKFFIFSPGIRHDHDLYVKLIDSTTKKVRILSFLSVYLYACDLVYIYLVCPAVVLVCVSTAFNLHRRRERANGGDTRSVHTCRWAACVSNQKRVFFSAVCISCYSILRLSERYVYSPRYQLTVHFALCILFAAGYRKLAFKLVAAATE